MEDPADRRRPRRRRPASSPASTCRATRRRRRSPTPTVDGRIDREVVLIEWKDRDIRERDVRGHGARAAAPAAAAAHPSAGRDDLQSGRAARRSGLARHVPRRRRRRHRASRSDSRRLNPQRLDTLVGKILRIVPDLREHAATSTVSENGRYRIPNDNPFVDARGRAQGDLGLRPAQSASADLGRRLRRRPAQPRLLAFNIGLVTWETVVIIHKGANYGYPLREGTQAMSPRRDGRRAGRRHDSDADLGHGRARHGQADLSGDCSTRTRGERRRRDRQRVRLPRHAGFPRSEASSCSATSRPAAIWYAEHGRRARGRRRQRRRPSRRFTRSTPACADSWKRRTARAAARARRCPGAAAVSGRGRVDLRFAVDNDGELYILTKSDGMIRKVVGARAVDRSRARCDVARRPSAGQTSPASRPRRSRIPWRPRPSRSPPGRRPTTPTAPPVTATWRRARSRPASSSRSSRSSAASSRRISPTTSGTTARATARSSPSSRRGVPPTMMAGFDGRISDDDIWNIVNYLRTLAREEVDARGISEPRPTAHHDEHDQPPLKLRRSAGALAKAEAHKVHEEGCHGEFFASVVSFVFSVMGLRDSSVFVR